MIQQSQHVLLGYVFFIHIQDLSLWNQKFSNGQLTATAKFLTTCTCFQQRRPSPNLCQRYQQL